MTDPLYQQLDIGERELISIVGAGGKSAVLFILTADRSSNSSVITVRPPMSSSARKWARTTTGSSISRAV